MGIRTLWKRILASVIILCLVYNTFSPPTESSSFGSADDINSNNNNFSNGTSLWKKSARKLTRALKTFVNGPCYNKTRGVFDGVIPQQSTFAWVTLVAGAKDSTFEMALVYAKALRDLNTEADVIFLVADDVPRMLFGKYWDKIYRLQVRILFTTPPVTPATVIGKGYREALTKSGLSWDHSKMRALQLVEYEKVIFQDADCLHLVNNDHLFSMPHLTGTDGPSSPLNSGFMVLRPSEEDFKGLVELGNEGDFTARTYWRKSYPPRYYANYAAETQGLWYYYFFRVKGRGHLLEQAVYNYQDTKSKQSGTRIVHFTACGKPTKPKENHNPLCGEFHSKWKAVWSSLFDKGEEPTIENNNGDNSIPKSPYVSIPPATSFVCENDYE
jgi:hypothetical protein